MKTTTQTRRLAAALTLGGILGLMTTEAFAQPNTYADFPYNQGSLFYRYNGPRTKPTARRVRTPRTVYYPTSTTAPRQPVYTYPYASPTGYYYVQPQYQYQYQARPGVR